MVRLGQVFLAALLVAVISGCSGQSNTHRDGGAASDTPGPVQLPRAGLTAQEPTEVESAAPGSGEQPENESGGASNFALSTAADSQSPVVAAATVIYRDSEFVPRRVEVGVGESVTFINESDKSFWPASNIHPTHYIYSEFDAMGPIPPGEVWTFTFEEAGFWRYHNHADPSVSGIVVVEGESTRLDSAPLVLNSEDISFEELGDVPAQDIINLFVDDTLLTRFVREYGPSATVRLLSEHEGTVGADCHQRAHIMGRIAYELFGPLAFSLSGHECHSGGYHGATEAFFRDRGTTDLQRGIALICGEGLNEFFEHQCVHGIGHGLMAWTSYELPDALQLCALMESSANELSCYSGVFMENVVGGLSGSMGHFTEYVSEDPHFPCNILEGQYLVSCYFYQTSRMVQLFSGDFEKVARACTKAPVAAHTVCFQSMGRDVGGVTRGDPARAIRLCSKTQERQHRLDCLEGAVQDSFWDAGGADDALAFCSLLQEQEEKQRCYSTITARAQDVLQGPSDVDEFCNSIEEPYRDQCP